jgi:bifunctional UDP-N-acetylglucosamine pyrophosphorylase/glucosamine-1-phosphate N-acetyltransferase
VKVSHLSYVGDAEIGENTNIGCGFITCNYDGVNKHKTKIGSNSFIGSDCQMIAPIEIGNDAFVAAGSTITKNVPDGGFGIARAQQVVKDGAAKRFLKRKKS